MSAPIDIDALLAASKCFLSLTFDQRSAIQTYLLASGIGDTTDPSVLANDARCFISNLDGLQMRAIQTSLMAQLINEIGPFPPSPPAPTCGSKSGDGPAIGNITPDFIGQLYTRNPGPLAIYFQSTGLTSADWQQIGSFASIFNGATESPMDGVGLQGRTGFTALNISGTQSSGVFLYNNANLLTVTAPALTTITGGGNSTTPGGSFSLSVRFNPALTSFSMPQLTAVTQAFTISEGAALTSIDLTSLATTGFFSISLNTLLASIALPSLTALTAFGPGNISLSIHDDPALTSFSAPVLGACAGNVQVITNAALASVDLSSLIPTNGFGVNFTGCALNQASVDLVLARCVANAGYVSGTVALNGGTNSTPSATGLADKATLIARGCTVLTN